jgi:tight adherence protein B
MINFIISFCGFCGGGLLSGSLVYYFLKLLPKKSPAISSSFKLEISLNSFQKVIIAGVLCAILVCIFVDVVWGIFSLMVCILLFYLKEKSPQLIQQYKKNKIQVKMSELFPQALGMCIQALKTGQTISQVLSYLSHECPQPLQNEIVLVCNEMSLGLSAEAALTKMNERFPNFSEFRQFLESYKISRQTGANLTHLLQVLMEGMEEKNRILRKMNAMTAQAKLSGMVMGLLPFMLGLIFFVMDPSLMTPLFTRREGWAILLLAAILESIGFLWIRRLLRVEI